MSNDQADSGTASSHLPDDLDAPRKQIWQEPPILPPHHSPLLEYNMKHEERGQAIIINNRDFHSSTQQQERIGTDVDAGAMETCLMRLGFCVTRHDNLRCAEMLRVMSAVARENHTESDCFLCVILSHGVENRVYGTDGTVSVNQVIEPFKGNKCPTLVGKPKIFFLQACRGSKYDRGVEVSDSFTDEVDAAVPSKLPVEADFLISYSVGSGYFSWRNSVDGSWYIQALSRVLEQHGDTLELMHLLTYVNRIVAQEYESNTGEQWTEGCKQVPSTVTQLTKLVYFRPKY